MNVEPGAAMTVTEAAAYWWVRHDAGSMTAREHQAFEAWCGASLAHREAYARAKHLWSGFEQQADSTELRVLRTAALAVPRQAKRWPRLAAVVLLCGVVSGLAIKLYLPGQPESGGRTGAAVPADGEQHTTAGNERSTITLSDGSIVTLNRDTTLDVAFTASERKVRITHGQAFFEVAKNPNRPFVVAVADRTVTALGTQFDVRLDADRIEVILVEGKVAVDHTDPSILERLNIRKARLELRPGEKLVAALGEPVAITDIDARRNTSWRQGWVTFENESVVDVVAELNRYSDRQIGVPDDSVRNLRLSGVFRVGQPDRFAATIQELLPVKAVQGGRGEILLIHTEPGATATH
jgi:transmembrane sensor